MIVDNYEDFGFVKEPVKDEKPPEKKKQYQSPEKLERLKSLNIVNEKLLKESIDRAPLTLRTFYKTDIDFESQDVESHHVIPPSIRTKMITPIGIKLYKLIMSLKHHQEKRIIFKSQKEKKKAMNYLRIAIKYFKYTYPFKRIKGTEKNEMNWVTNTMEYNIYVTVTEVNSELREQTIPIEDIIGKKIKLLEGQKENGQQ